MHTQTPVSSTNLRCCLFCTPWGCLAFVTLAYLLRTHYRRLLIQGLSTNYCSHTEQFTSLPTWVPVQMQPL